MLHSPLFCKLLVNWITSLSKRSCPSSPGQRGAQTHGLILSRKQFKFKFKWFCPEDQDAVRNQLTLSPRHSTKQTTMQPQKHRCYVLYLLPECQWNTQRFFSTSFSSDMGTESSSSATSASRYYSSGKRWASNWLHGENGYRAISSVLRAFFSSLLA